MYKQMAYNLDMGARSSRKTDPPREAPPRRERFGARLTPVQKELIQRAASLTGRSMTEFILNAAQAAAEETIRTYQVLELTTGETEAFIAALDKPRRLHRRLEEAIRTHGDSVEMTW